MCIDRWGAVEVSHQTTTPIYTCPSLTPVVTRRVLPSSLHAGAEFVSHGLSLSSGLKHNIIVPHHLTRLSSSLGCLLWQPEI